MSTRIRPEDLFRKEVRPHVALGAPMMRFPLSLWYFVALAICTVALLCFAAFLIPYTQKHSVTGSIVASGTGVDVELRIPADSMRYVRRGLRVSWHAASLPRARYGLFQGTVVDFEGPETTEHSAAFYLVRLRLDESSAASPQVKEQLLPGMTVTATLSGQSKPLVKWLFDVPGEVL